LQPVPSVEGDRAEGAALMSAAPGLAETPTVAESPVFVPEAAKLEEPVVVTKLSEQGEPESLAGKTTEEFMQKDQKEAYEKIVAGVVQIIFGDSNVSDMNIRLVRIALERYGVQDAINRLAGQTAS
jgi:hypothetical protein